MDVWDTKRCTNKGCKVNVVNRDVNGAANMLMLTKCFLRMHFVPQLWWPPCFPFPFPPTPRPWFADRGNQLRQSDPVRGKQLCRQADSGISSTRICCMAW